MIQARAETPEPVDRLWSVVNDVTAWPRHLTTFISVERAGGPEPIGVGSRFDVRQPGLPAATYEVTEWTSDTSFTWVARSPGIVTTASHIVTEVEHGSRIELTIAWTGPLAGLVRLVLGPRTRRMIELEATTLARVSESRD